MVASSSYRLTQPGDTGGDRGHLDARRFKPTQGSDSLNELGLLGGVKGGGGVAVEADDHVK